MNITKIKDGIYTGGLCNLVVKNGSVAIVMSDEQLDILRFTKNYEHHFDENGDWTGSGCCLTAFCKNQGEILSHTKGSANE